MKVFFDTYALYEIVKGNPDYSSYLDEKGFTTIFHLAEFYYAILREYGADMAEELYFEFHEFAQPVDDEIIIEAMQFRFKNKKKKLSYADSIGYIYAEKHKIKFVTGDKEFEGLPNTEFIK